jgi:hypothetical protein
MAFASRAQVSTDKTAAWANSAAANTEVNLDFTQPGNFTSKHRVQVHNPSSVTALTVKVQNTVSLGGSSRQALLQTISVGTSSTKETLVEGMFGGTDGVRLTLSNDTVLGLSDAFTADVAVRQA